MMVCYNYFKEPEIEFRMILKFVVVNVVYKFISNESYSAEVENFIFYDFI